MNEQSQRSDSGNEEIRRNFLVKFAAAAISGLVAIVPAVFAGGFFLTPLLKKKGKAGESDGFTPVGSVSNLVAGGPPRAFKVTGRKQDAWTTYDETAIGAVFIKMSEAGELTAFNASCPHLGCSVNYKADKHEFLCPCHDSAFTLNGERSNEIPPRNMDSLQVEIRNDNEIWVKFESFRAGTSAKVPV